MKWKKKKPKWAVISLIAGLLFLFSALLATFFRATIHNWVDAYILKQNALSEHSMMTQLWVDPPLTPQLRIYLYNVTNSQEFLDGKADIKLEEIGPYTYEAPQIKKVQAWSGDQIDFQSRTTYHLLNGKNADLDTVVMPNLLMMTGMLKTEVKDQPDFLKKSIVWPILMSTGQKTPFVKLTVSQYLWGYEDELACLDSEKSDSEDSFFDDLNDDFFYDEKSAEKSTKYNFRRENGKCIFGALIEKNGTWERPVRMNSGEATLTKRGLVTSLDHSKHFGIWQQNSQCDSLSGTREPSALPPTESMDEFDMLMGIMCRSIRMETRRNVDYGMIAAKRFTMSLESFRLNSQENKCYDPIADLPDGIFNVAKCCQGSPLAVSSPHFLHADPWYLDQVEGISPPNPKLHELYIDLEPHLGALVGAQARFQLNLVVRRDAAFPPLANLSRPVTVIPLFWLQEGYEKLPSAAMQKLKLALMLPNLLADGLIIVGLVVGVLLVMWPLFQGARNLWVEQQMYNLEKDKTYNPLPFEDDSQL